MSSQKKLIRITTIPLSLNKLIPYQLKFMSRHYDVLAIANREKDLEQVNPREGVRTMGVVMTRAITPFTDMKGVWELYKIFKKEKPLIVHTHTPKAGLLGMLAGKMAGVPVRMHTVAGLPLLEATGGKRKLLDFVEKLTYSCAHKVYPNSAELKRIIIDNGLCKAEKLKVIGNGSSNGIDTAYFAPGQVSDEKRASLKQELGIGQDDFVFSFVGRMVGDKGINEMVKAFTDIYKANPKIKLILVGPFERELDALATETETYINEHPAIKWVGFQEDIRPYLAVSSVFVFPSYREGFPNVVMQAGAMGLPSIVSNINGCNEIIEEGINGTIIPVKDSDALRDKMLLLFNDAIMRKSMAAVARKMIVERYAREFVWEELLKEYERMERTS